MTSPAGASDNLRIGNDERAAAQRALDEHLGAGRLEMDEFADRYAAAGVARTRSDLEALFTDLPAPHPFPSAVPAPPRRQSASWRATPVWGVVRLVAMVLAGVALFSLLPFFAAGALVWFVVVPMLAGRGGPWRGGCGRRWRY